VVTEEAEEAEDRLIPSETCEEWRFLVRGGKSKQNQERKEDVQTYWAARIFQSIPCEADQEPVAAWAGPSAKSVQVRFACDGLMMLDYRTSMVCDRAFRPATQPFNMEKVHRIEAPLSKLTSTTTYLTFVQTFDSFLISILQLHGYEGLFFQLSSGFRAIRQPYLVQRLRRDPTDLPDA
jgi:hypothetical protein